MQHSGAIATDEPWPDTLEVAPSPTGVTCAIAHCCRRRRQAESIRDVSLPRVRVDPSVSNPTPSPSGQPLSVPDTLRARFVTAPLCYYLGCPPQPSATTAVTVPDPVGDGVVTVARQETLDTEIATALRRILTLDRLVNREGTTPSVVTDLEGDPDHIRSLPSLERLALASRHGSVLDDHAPTWPIATYLDPDPHSIRALPYVLDRLSLVGRPRATSVSPTDHLDLGLSANRPRADGKPSLCRPRLLPARTHLWCGDGDPIGAVPTSVASLRPRTPASDRPTVVLVDALPDRQTTDTTDRLERRLAALAPGIRVHTVEAPTRRRLRSVLSGSASVVYLRGHGEPSGLVCRDGILNPASVDSTDVGIAVLNTCSSTRAGHALLDAGCRAAVVTRAPVIDPTAASVGETILIGLAFGFCLERTVRLARLDLLLRTDYRVIGDPHRRLRYRSTPPRLAVATRVPDGGLVVRFTTWHPHPSDEPIEAQPTRDVESTEAVQGMPVLLDGTVHWPTHETFSPPDIGEIIQSHR